MTPLWEMLSSRYELVYLGQPQLFPLLKKYNYFSHYIIGCEYPFKTESTLSRESVCEILQLFPNTQEQYMMYDSDESITFLNNHPELNYIKSHPSVLNNEEVMNKISCGAGFSVLGETRKSFIRFQLTNDSHDFRIRLFADKSLTTSDEIVIYQGSGDRLRKLSDNTIVEFAKRIPSATFLITQSAVTLLNRLKINPKYILTKPTTVDGLFDVLKLFQSRPKVMVGPDSGLTQWALAHGIPQIWLQSKIRPENVIDPSYFDKITVYFKKNLTCAQDCVGCAIRKENGETLCPTPFLLKSSFTHHSMLRCQKDPVPSCLNYSTAEIEEIISLIKDR